MRKNGEVADIKHTKIAYQDFIDALVHFAKFQISKLHKLINLMLMSMSEKLQTQDDAIEGNSHQPWLLDDSFGQCVDP